MKSGATFLLLGLLALWAQLPPASAQVRPGACPEPKGMGLCVELCEGDDSCPPGWKCCSTACGGRVCKKAVTRPQGTTGASPGKQLVLLASVLLAQLGGEGLRCHWAL